MSHTLILDLGGVLFVPSWRKIGISATAAKLHVSNISFQTALQKYQPSFYTGTISEQEYWSVC